MPKISSNKVNSNSLSGNEMDIKTIQTLKAELLRLRESSKKKLKRSRKEIETLKQCCATHLQSINHLENDVIEAKRKEKYWHKRCLDAEFKLLQDNNKRHESMSSCISFKNCLSETDKSNPIQINIEREQGKPSLYHDSTERAIGSTIKFVDRKSTICSVNGKSKHRVSTTGLCSMLGLSWQSVGKNNKVQDSESKDDHSSFESKSERKQGYESSEQQHCVEKERELKAKLAEREYAIRSLEQSMENHVRAMHTLQAEMECRVETQRMKEEKNQVTHRQKESFLEDQLSNLKNDINKKNDLVTSQKKREDGYKKHIEKLESRLE